MGTDGHSESVHDGTGYVEPATPSPTRRAREKNPASVKIGVGIVVAIAVVGLLGGLVCTKPWSNITVTIDNLAGRPAQIAVFIDHELAMNATLGNFTEAWSVSFDVVFGTHVVSVNYVFQQPQAHELTRILYVGPFSTAQAYCVLMG